MNQELSHNGICNCETCLDQEIAEPNGDYECRDCGAPIQKGEACDVETDCDGDRRYFHAICPNGEGPAEPKEDIVEQVVELIQPLVRIVEINQEVQS